MTPLLRLGIGLLAVALAAPIVWLASDFFYARHVRASAARHPGRASAEPFALNPAGAPALLLVHGFADGPAVFAQLAPRLAAEGCAVRALHLTGFGGGPDRMADATLAAWRGDLDREIAALRAESPDRPIWLVGHSLGGALAFDAALRPANRIAGLVLLAPLVQVSRARSPVLSPRQWFEILDRLLVFTDIVESRLPKDLRDPAARAEYHTDKFIHRAAYRALFAAVDAVRPRAAEWRGPLFMAIAPADQIVDSAATRFFFAASNAAPARLTEIHAAGHVLPLDYGHDKLAGRIARFVRETPPPAAP